MNGGGNNHPDKGNLDSEKIMFFSYMWMLTLNVYIICLNCNVI